MATKRPKRPKTTASLTVWQNYDKRVKEHDRKIAEKKRDKAKKAALIKRLSK